MTIPSHKSSYMWLKIPKGTIQNKVIKTETLAGKEPPLGRLASC